MTGGAGSQVCSELYTAEVGKGEYPLTGLQPGKLYHFRAASTNGLGTRLSSDVTFVRSLHTVRKHALATRAGMILRFIVRSDSGQSRVGGQ